MRVADTPSPHEISSSRSGVSVHVARAETVPPPRAANVADVAGGSIEPCPGYAPVGGLVAVPPPFDLAAPDAAPDAEPDGELDAEPDAAGRRDGPVAGDQESAASRKPVPGVPEAPGSGWEKAAPVARCGPADPADVPVPASAAREALGAGAARVLRARSLGDPSPA